MAEVKTDPFSDNENAIFNEEWDRLFTTHFRAREIIDIYQDHKDAIKLAAEVAKYQLEVPFGGQLAKTNEFGWGPIQPNQILATSAATYSTATWEQVLSTSDVTTRWKDWIGSSASNLKISKYGTIIFIGFADPEPVPKIDAILPRIKGIDYPIIPLYDQMIDSDYHVAELASPWIVEKEQEIYFQELVGRAGRSKLRPLGVYFAKGDNMRSKTQYAQV
jgi:hypothetical protein